MTRLDMCTGHTVLLLWSLGILPHTDKLTNRLGIPCCNTVCPRLALRIKTPKMLCYF